MVKIDLSELQSPIDITNDLIPECKKIFELSKIRVFAASLDYLLENITKLQNEKNEHYFTPLNSFDYYSPANWSYDFSNLKDSQLDLGDEDQPGMIIYNEEPIPIYVHEQLAEIKPTIAYKAYSKKKKLEPIGLNIPIFAINSHPNSKLLVPFVLMDFDEIYITEDKMLYSKYTN